MASTKGCLFNQTRLIEHGATMPEEYLFDTSIERIKFVFKFSGMNIESTRRTYPEVVRDRAIYLFNFLWLNTDVLGEIFWYTEGANLGIDFLELTYIAPCTTLCFLANLKSICHLLNESSVNQLVDDMRRLEANIKTGEDDGTNKKRNDIVKTETRFLNVVISALNFWNIMTGIALGMSPLILMYLKYSKTNAVDLMIPFPVVYYDLIDPYDIKYWPFVYLHQFWSVWIVVFEISAADFLLFTCCTYIKIQFRLLQHDFKNLIPTKNGVLDSLYADRDMRENMVRLINWHQEIIRSVDLLEIIYSKSTLFNFVSSSLIICLTGFNATAIDDIASVFSFLSFLSMSLLQIFLLCFFGDMIESSSMEVSNAVYNCSWYLTDVNLRKKLLIIIISLSPCMTFTPLQHIRPTLQHSNRLELFPTHDQSNSGLHTFVQPSNTPTDFRTQRSINLIHYGGRCTDRRIYDIPYGLFFYKSQKPCRLTASGFADVNLKAFTKILSTAWSYFALLKSVYGSEK